MIKKFDLLFIAIAGVSTAEIFKHINLFLQTLILIATLAGILWKHYKNLKK